MRKKNARSLEAILRDLQATDREHIFKIGDLLLEAKAAYPGKFLDWLAANYDQSHDTAERFMRVAKLSERFRRLRNLNLPRTALYELGGMDEAVVGLVIEALAKLDTRRPIKKSEADEIIEEVRLQREHGSFPLATLRSLDEWQNDEPATKAVVKALKREKPETEEAAKTVIDETVKAYALKLFAPHGTLPEIPEGSWLSLAEVDPKDAAAVFAQITRAPQPLTEDAVDQICWHTHSDTSGGGDDDTGGDDDDDGGDDDDDDDGKDAGPGEPPPETPLGLPSVVAAACKSILEFMRGPCAPVAEEITGSDLTEVIEYLKRLHHTMSEGNRIKAAADRAEARARQNKQNGPAL